MRKTLQPQALPRGSFWVSILSPGGEETPPQSAGAPFYCRRSPAFEREPWPFLAAGQGFANNGLLSLRGGDACYMFKRHPGWVKFKEKVFESACQVERKFRVSGGLQ